MHGGKQGDPENTPERLKEQENKKEKGKKAESNSKGMGENN